MKQIWYNLVCLYKNGKRRIIVTGYDKEFLERRMREFEMCSHGLKFKVEVQKESLV